MNKTYEKPLARNLGELVSSAEGNTCADGSTALGPTGSHCTLGHTASGGDCFNGQSVTGCAAGGTANAWECKPTGGGF